MTGPQRRAIAALVQAALDYRSAHLPKRMQREELERLKTTPAFRRAAADKVLFDAIVKVQEEVVGT